MGAGARVLALIGVALVLGACRPRGGEAPEAVPTPFDDRPYAEGPIDPGTRVFLVAGGDDIANFAQEVATQQHLWRQAGVPDETMACYWAKPSAAAWREDQEQYYALQTQVKGCRRAEPATLRRDLLAVAKDDPEFVYLFITAHGLPPLLSWKAGASDHRGVAAKFDLGFHELEVLDQHVIGLQAGPGPRLEQVGAIVDAYKDGTDPGELMLSPGTLADALSQFPKHTLKIVVLQACFSGGFIGDKDAEALSPLTEVDNVVVLTATAHDRPSFGCGAGSVSTYYGGAINKSLARRLEPGRTPADVAWEQVWEDAAFAVDVMESIDGERASVPGFFSNVGEAPVVR